MSDLDCARCGENEGQHGNPAVGASHDFLPATDANLLRVWAKAQYIGESRELMLRGADALEAMDARKAPGDEVADRVERWLAMGNCGACGWSLAKTAAEGCVAGDCSYRPDDPEEKRHRKACLEYLERRDRDGIKKAGPNP